MPLASLNSKGKTNQVRQHGAMEFSDPPVDLDKVRQERKDRRLIRFHTQIVTLYVPEDLNW